MFKAAINAELLRDAIAALAVIIEYCTENAEKFNEYSKRIVLWLISLYKPAPEKILLLGNILDSFISVKANYQTTAFDLTPYKNELMRIDTARRTLPKVEKVNVEFQTQ